MILRYLSFLREEVAKPHDVFNLLLDHKQFAALVNKLIRAVMDLFGLVVYLVTWVTGTWLGPERECLPPIRSPLLHLSATQIATRIKSKELKCTEVIEAYINRIKDVQPMLNSVVQDRFDDALKEAAEVDQRVEASKNPSEFADRPLLGVPLTVKETIAVKGMSNNGARSRVSHHIAEEDAKIVKAMRNAGAIPLLVSNTPELCMYLETSNARYGRTNNPYDNRRTCGGSSGGEASLVGAGASVVGLGSDIGGSLRIPAFFCGVYGHKPTPGYVPNDGHVPTSTDPMWDFYFTLGPITRYAEDLPLMLKNMIPDKSKADKLLLDESVDVSKLRIFFMYGEGPDSILQNVPGIECVRAMTLATAALRDKFKCKVEEANISDFRDTVFLNSQILQMSGIENVFQTSDDKPDDWGLLRIVSMLLKKITCRTYASFSCLLFGPLKMVADLTPDNVRTIARQKTSKMQETVTELLGNDGVLLYPSFSEEAPFHYRLCSRILDISYTTIFNILGMPVTQCPVGLSNDGVPIGIQVVAAAEQDRLCMAVAQALEKELGGWVPPPLPKQKA